MPKFLFILEEPIINIFWHLKVCMKSDDLDFTNWKKKIFSSACTGVLEKYLIFFFKNAKFWFFDFLQNIHSEVVLPTSKYKKWLFWIVLSIFCPENFFHRTVSFFSKRAWKSSKILKIGFFEKICFFWKNVIFRI